MPVADAAALRPPKSIDAVPDNMECTMLMASELTMNAAMQRAQLWGDEIPIGRFYEDSSMPALHQLEPILDEGGPLAHRDVRVPADIARQFVEELM